MSYGALTYLRRQYLCVLRRCAMLNSTAALAVLGAVGLAPSALPVAQAAPDVVPDGRTLTRISTQGAVSDISTATVRGANAFNSFSRFNIGSGETVNLHLPTNTANLLNLVRDQRSTLDGVLNAYKDGRIGGNVYFFNPYGLVVGAQGQVNVGNLVLAAPTPGFLDRLVGAGGLLDDSAAADALAGRYSLHGSGLITVKGSVRAAGVVQLAAAQVDIAAGGRVEAGAAVRSGFGALVNIDGLEDAARLLQDGDTVRIVASHGVTVAGAVAADGAPGQAAGRVAITAGGDVLMADGARVSADGQGAASAGGTVFVMAEKTATLAAGAELSARGGQVSGDGGHIEFSARETVRLQGGAMKAGVTQGARGSVLVDPNDIEVVASNQHTDGADFTLVANNSITVNNDVTLSTRNLAVVATDDHLTAPSQGDSGHLSLRARSIELKPGSRLLAHGDNGHQGGDVKVEATALDALAVTKDATASITATGATITGKNILLRATAETSAIVELLENQPNLTLEDAQKQLNNELDDPIDGLAGQFMTATSKATASTTLLGTTVQGSGAVTIGSRAGARAGFEKTASATTTIGSSGARDTAISGQTVDIFATASTSLIYNILGRATQLVDPGWTPDPEGSLIQHLDDVFFDFNSIPLVALSSARASVLLTGATRIDAVDTATLRSQADSAAKPTFAGLIVFSAAWGDSTASAQTQMLGTTRVTAGGAVNVEAKTDTDIDVTATVNSVNKPIDATFVRAQTDITTLAATGADTQTTGSTVTVQADTTAKINASATAANTGGSGVGLALAISETTSNTTATMGGTVQALTGNATVKAEADITEASAADAATLGDPNTISAKITNFQAGIQRNVVGGILGSTTSLSQGTQDSLTSFMFPGIKEGKFNAAGAVSWTDSTNTASASVAAGADVRAQGDVAANAKITDAPGSSAGSKSTSTGTAIGGAVAVGDFNNSASAYVGAGAKVDAMRLVKVDAQTLVPYPWQIDWQNPEEILAFLQGGILDMALTTHSINSAKGKSGVGLAVGVNIFDLTNSATAYLDHGALVNSRFKGINGLGNQAVSVTAGNDISLTGASGILSKKFLGTSGGKAAIGGSASLVTLDTAASATVRSGAEVDSAGAVDVKADNAQRVVTVTEAGGSSDSVGVEGTVTLNTLKNTSTAAVDDDATLRALGNVGITAKADLENIAVAGGVVATKGPVGIGFSVSLNTVKSGVTALLGDIDGPGVDSVGASGLVNTGGALVVKADSDISQGAYSVVGAIATQSKAQTDPPAAGGQETGDGAASAGGASQSGKGKFGIAVSGDVSLNTIDADTLAVISSGAKVTRATALDMDATNVLALSSLAGAVTISTQNEGNSLAGSYAQNTLTGTTAAAADDATLTLSGPLTADAHVTGTIETLSASIAGAKGKLGVAGSVSINDIDNETRTSLNKVLLTGVTGVTLNALDDSAIRAIAGAIAFGGKAGIGLSFGWNKLDNTTESWVADSDVDATGLVTIQARTNNSIDTISAAIAASRGPLAAAGAVTINTLHNATKAWVAGTKGGDGVDGDAGVRVEASDSSRIFGLGGSLGASTQQAGVGAAFAWNDVDNTVDARLKGNADVASSAGDVRLDAASTTHIEAITASGGVANNVGIAGAATVVQAKNTVKAAVDAGSVAVADGNVVVAAADDVDVFSLAGNVALGGKVGIGASASLLITDNTVSARVDGSVSARGNRAAVAVPTGSKTDARVLRTENINGVSITATSHEDIQTIAAGGAGGGKVGVAGSATVTLLTENTEAVLGANARINAADDGVATQDVLLRASDETTLLGVAGAVAFGGKAGVGAGADVGVINKTTSASVGAGALLFGNRDVKIDARSREDINSIAASLAAGGSAGVAGSASVYVVTVGTSSSVAGTSTVHSDGNVVVSADNASELDLIAGNAAFGGSAGIGASAAVAIIDKTTTAKLGNGAQVTALGKAAGTTVADGRYSSSYAANGSAEGEISAPSLNNSDGSTSGALSGQRVATAGSTAGFTGLAVTATNKDDVETISATGAASGSVSATLAGGVNVITTHTTAEIGDNARINTVNTGAGATQAVRVAAANDHYQMGVAGAASASGAVGVGVGADVLVAKHTTTAAVGASAQVRTLGDVDVLATAQQEVLSIAVGLGVSGSVAVAGSTSVLALTSTTSATTGALSVVDADGNVRIAAVDDTQTDVVDGSLSAGFGVAGVGGAVGVVRLEKDTTAGVGAGATVKARGTGAHTLQALSGDDLTSRVAITGLSVEARSSENLFAVAASGAGGFYAGVSGAVNFASVDSDTTAVIGSGALVNQGVVGSATQDVNVSARNSATVKAGVGSLGLGAVGVAGAVDVGLVQNDTTAEISDDAKVHAHRDVDVNALTSARVDSIVVSAAGGVGAVAGAVSVVAVGSGLDAEGKDRLKSPGGDQADVNSYADTQAGDNSISQLLMGSNDTRIKDAATRSQAARGAVRISADLAAANQKGTTARIGKATVTADGAVDVDARQAVGVRMDDGAAAGGALGLGAGISVLTVNAGTQAQVASQAQISSGGLASMTARTDNTLAAKGYAGVLAGTVAVDAAAAIVSDKSLTRATLGDDVTFTGTGAAGSGSVQVLASDDRRVNAEAIGVSVSGLVAAGASVATVSVTGGAQAEAGEHLHVGSLGAATAAASTVGAFALQAESTTEAIAASRAGKAGLGLAASGSVATASTTPDVHAHVGDSSRITVGGLAQVDATAHSAADANAIGVNVAGGVGIGASVALATNQPQVAAALGDSATVVADAAAVTATAAVRGAGTQATGTGASGGLLAGVNATAADAVGGAAVSATLGDDSTLTLGNSLAVTASNSSRQRADVTGISAGFLALGATLGEARSTSSTTATMGDDVRVSSAAGLTNNLTVSATGSDNNSAKARAGSGGIVSGSAADASTRSTSTTTASVGSGSDVRSINAAGLRLLADHSSLFNSEVDSISASAVGASGATSSHYASSTVNTTLADGARVNAQQVDIDANNRALKLWLGTSTVAQDAALAGDAASWNIQSGSGGALNAAAGASNSTVNLDTTARLGAGAQVHVLMPATGVGSFTMDAFNQVVGHDKAKLDSGGLVAVALTETRFNAGGRATAELGDNAHITSDLGDIGIGSSAQVDLDTRASSDTYGLAGAPAGKAYSTWLGDNRTVLNSGAQLLADQGAVRLAAGQNSAGAAGSVQADSEVRLWNKTAIPINGTPDAQTRVTSNAALELLGTADVQSAADTTLSADPGSIEARHIGIGKDIYRETASAVVSGISQAFGGDSVSYDITGGSTVVGGVATARVDGSVLAGIRRVESLTLDYQLVDANDNPVEQPVYDPVTKLVMWKLVTTKTNGVGLITKELAKGLATNINARITKLRSLMDQYANDPVAVAAYDAEITFLQFKLVELGLAKGDPTTNNFVAGTGQNPSPQARQRDEIRRVNAQIDNLGNGIVVSATTANTSASGALPQQTLLSNNAATVVLKAGSVNTSNGSIDTTLRQMSGFVATDPDFVNLSGLHTAAQTLRGEISALRDLQTPEQTAVDTRNAALQTFLGSISTRETQMTNLLASGAPDTQVQALQAQIDTDRASATSELSSLSSVMNSLAARNTSIDSKSALLRNTYTQMDTLQSTLKNRFAAAADAALKTSVTNLQTGNTTPLTDLANAATQVGSAATAVAGATSTVATSHTSATNQTTALGTAKTDLAALELALPGLSAVAADGPVADFLTVPDITVRLGNIHVKADSLTGTGALKAPGDAKITITNNTPNFLVLGKLTVANDSGGEVRLNGFLINDTTEVGRINKNGIAPGLTLQTKHNGAAGVPAIEVISNYDPNSAKDARLPAPSPDIQLSGDVSNPLGSVRVYSQAGSILVDAGVDIRAAQVDVKADNGDFVQSFIDGFRHTSGDPAGNAQGGNANVAAGPGIVANGSVLISARFLNINGLVQSGVESWQIDLPTNPILTGTATLFGVNQALLDQLVRDFKNGTSPQRVQVATASGRSITFDAQLARLEADTAFAEFDRQSAGWATRTAASGGLYPLISSYGNIGANYDVSVPGGRYVLDGELVKGGFIQLTGQILNTADGNAARLRVIDGFGQITVNNPTDRPVVVGRLSTGADASGSGRGIQGVIDISDVQRVNTTTGTGTADIIRTIYTRSNNQVQVQQTGRWEGNIFNAGYQYSGVDTTATGARQSSYAPQTGLRYVWTTATDKGLQRFYEYSGSQFLGISSLRTEPSGTLVSSSGPFTTSVRRLDDGTYLLLRPADTLTPFIPTTNTLTTGDIWTKTNDWSNCNWWTLCIAQDYHTTWTRKTSTSTITANSLKADYGIAVEFSGSNSGLVAINSASNVLLGGAIDNRWGSTSVHAGVNAAGEVGYSRAGQSVLQHSDAAVINTQQLILRASASLGAAATSTSAANALALNLNGGTLNASANAGNVVLRQTQGDLRVANVNATGAANAGLGQVLLQADGSLLAADANSTLTGNRIELTSDNGGIGTQAAPLQLQAGATQTLTERGAYGVKAGARNGIYLDALAWAGNPDADLLVSSVVSATGDVQLRTPGRIIDNNPFERTDTRTYNQLLALWDDLALLRGSTKNAAKQTAALAAFEAGASQDYRSYWQLRNQQADPASFDASYRVTLSPTQETALRADLARQGQTLDQINSFISDYGNSKTAEYQALHHKLYAAPAYENALPQRFEEGFSYTASAAERAAHLKGSSWTERELGIALSPGLLKEVSDTNPVLKDPNVAGANVRLLAGRGIGETGGVRLVDLTQDPRNISDADKVAIAAAERDDLSVTAGVASVTERKPVVVDSSGALTAQGLAGAAVQGDVFLASENALRLASLLASGQARLKVAGDLSSGAAPGAAVLTVGKLVLESSTGSIGSAASPLLLQLAPNNALTARADGDMHIGNTAGDLLLDTLFARGGVWLTTPGSIVDAFNNNDVNIRAGQLTLTAAGAIGSIANPLDIGVGPRLASITDNNDNSGRLRASAGGGITLRSPELPLVLNQVQAGTELQVVAGTSLTVDGAVSAALNVDLAAADELRFDGGRVSSDTVVLTAGTAAQPGSGRVSGSTPTGPDVVASRSVTVTAGQSIGGDAALELVAPLVTLRARQMQVDAGPVSAAETLTVNATGTADAADAASRTTDDVVLTLRSGNAVHLQNVTGQRMAITAETPRVDVQHLQGTLHARLQASGDLAQAAAPDTAAIEGGSLVLQSTSGRIGSSAQPLLLQQSNGAKLDAQAAGGIHIRQTQGDLLLGRVQAGGAVALQTPGALLDGLAGDGANVLSQQLTLKAQGNIGQAVQAVVIDLAPGATLDAQTPGELHIRQIGGDLQLQAVRAGGAASLQASGSVLDAQTTGNTAGNTAGNTPGSNVVATVQARELRLQSQAGIGTAAQPLTLELGPSQPGTGSGGLFATAGAGVYLRSAVAPLVLRQVTAGTEAELSAGTEVRVDGSVQAPQRVDVAAGDNIRFTERGSIHSSEVRLTAGQAGTGRIIGVAGNTPRVLASTSAELVAPVAVGGGSDAAPEPSLVVITPKLDVQSDRIGVKALAPHNQQALTVQATGVGNTLASHINLQLNSDSRVTLHQLAAVTSQVNAQAPLVDLLDGRVGNSAVFETPTLRFRMDAIDRSPQPGYDVRAFTLTGLYNFAVTPDDAQIGAFVIAQNPFKAVFGQPPGNAVDLAGQQLRLLSSAMQGPRTRNDRFRLGLVSSPLTGAPVYEGPLLRIDRKALDCSQPGGASSCY